MSPIYLLIILVVVQVNSWRPYVEHPVVYYDVDLRCPMASWSVKRVYYEEDPFDIHDFLYETSWQNSTDPIMKAVDTFIIEYQRFEFDLFYEPFVKIYHTCSSEKQQLLLYFYLPKVGKELKNFNAEYVVYLLENGKVH